jgi:hypothetical protein
MVGNRKVYCGYDYTYKNEYLVWENLVFNAQIETYILIMESFTLVHQYAV